MALPTLVQNNDASSLSRAGPSGLAIICKTWTLTGELKQRLNFFCTGGRKFRDYVDTIWIATMR